MQATDTFDLRLRKVEAGPALYKAMVYVNGLPLGHVLARRGGKFEAYTTTNRLIGVADSLIAVRELIRDHYADNHETFVGIVQAPNNDESPRV